MHDAGMANVKVLGTRPRKPSPSLAATRKRELGQIGEALAAQAIGAVGLRVIAQNWRGHRGELDIVALDGATLVGIEVKTRSTLNFGHPAAAITGDKLMRMKRLLCQWINENRAQLPHLSGLRLDVISVLYDSSSTAKPIIEHLKGIS